jgi:prepilin-type N-terminal cleavage/methylation domain-containing protein
MRAFLNERLRADQRGFTLVEMVVVMTILTIILAGLSTSMIAGTNSEVVIAQRQQAQSNARIALERMRLDIHCASGVLGPQENGFGGFTLTLTETQNVCPSVTNLPSGVQWCTIPYAGSTTRFQLFRETSGNCDGVGETLLVDFISQPPAGWPTNTATTPTPTDYAGNIWPTSACTTGTLPTTSLDININTDPNHPEGAYELKDAIAMRNALPCT